jgi:protein O-GlcNAc transferase
MGVPVLTMKGYNFNSRCGESINKNLNLMYLIADDENDYISKAKEFLDKEKLVNTRNIVFNNLLKSPLFDGKKFSKEFLGSLEAIYNK